MKLALIASLYAPHVIGGAERVAQSQAEALAARGHAVHVLTLGAPGSGTVREMLNGVHVVRAGIHNLYLPGVSHPTTWTRVAWHARDVYNAAMARVAREQLADLRPDIVVCHNVYGWSAAVWQAAQSLDLPLVQVLHDQYLRCVRSNMFTTSQCASPCVSCRLMRLPHRHLSRIPNAAVGVSRYVVDSITEAGYFRDVPIRTHIRNTSHLDTRLQLTPSLNGPEIVFGFIGSLTPGKGIELLLSSFVAVAQPNWRLRVAGTGAPDYMQRLRTAYPDGRIEFLGHQDPASFYLGLDATVVPSILNEALGNVVFESLIHGRPVIGSRRGGIPEMIDEGVSGLLFEPDTDGALGLALRHFGAKIEWWRSRQATIKAAAAPLYCDRAAWISRWESLFQTVLDKGSSQ